MNLFKGLIYLKYIVEERKRPINATDLAILSILDSNEATTGDKTYHACDFGRLNPEKLRASLEHLTIDNLIEGSGGGIILPLMGYYSTVAYFVMLLNTKFFISRNLQVFFYDEKQRRNVLFLFL